MKKKFYNSVMESILLRIGESYSKKIFSKTWFLVLLLIIGVSGCKKDSEKPGIVNPCPVVVSTDPMDKAPDVALNKVISATFNTAMDSANINKTTFTIKQVSSSTFLSGTVAPTTNGAIFTFTPDVPLLPFTKYIGTITTGATDKYRTSLVNDYVWSFTTIPQVTLSSNPIAGGTTTGAGSFAQSSVVTVKATPNTGYTFINWTDSGSVTPVSTSSSFQFTMNGNRALVANFSLIPPTQFAVNLSSNPIAGGTTFGAGLYNTGTSVTVIETPNPGYSFVNWTENGTIVSANSSYTFPLTATRTLVANFSLIPALQFAVQLSSNPPSGGSTSGSGSFNAGASVTINATANVGYTFVNWTDGATIASTSATYTFPLTANRTLVANFAINTFALNVLANPVIGGTVQKNPNQALVNYGTFVTITAAPSIGYTFLNWTEGVNIVSTSLNYSFQMFANRTFVANFVQSGVATLIDLASASVFGAFGGNAGVTNQGLNTVINNGGIASTSASSLITGFHDGKTGDVYTETPLDKGNVTGGIFTAPPAPGNAISFLVAQKALADANTAYINISPASKPGGIDPGAGELGGLTLAPGVYQAASGTFKITNGDLTLDAKGNPNAVWIFQTAAALTVGNPAASRNVNLIGGALAKNVFWYVGSNAVINYGGGGTMVGTIIAYSGVTLSSPGVAVQTVLNGRALSLVSSVTMVNTTINIPQ
jgi:hypothetical protein